MLINRLFVQAYQSPYPQSLCGGSWTMCSSHQNSFLLLLLQLRGRTHASSLEETRINNMETVRISDTDSLSVCPFYNVWFSSSLCKTGGVSSPTERFPECIPLSPSTVWEWDKTVSTFLECWIPRSNNSSFPPSHPSFLSFLPPLCPLLHFRGLRHTSASWPALLGPFNHTWHTQR